MTAAVGSRGRDGREASEEELREELSAFLHDYETWPSYREFERRGRKTLRDRVTRSGGAKRWAAVLGVPYGEHRPGHAPIWTEERIRADLASSLRGRERWPTRLEFEDAGLKALRDAVARTGGPPRWAAEFRLPRVDERRGSRRVWTEERIEAELRKFTAGRSEWPSKGEFRAAGKASLLTAAYVWGGVDQWASRLELSRERKAAAAPRVFWTGERIREELIEFCAGRSSWPPYSEFVSAGKKTLYQAASRKGGIEYWAHEIGMKR